MKTWLQRLAGKLRPPEPEEAMQEAGREEEREFGNAAERAQRVRELGEVKGRLVFALEAAVQADEDGKPMEPQDIKALADMARRYLDGLDRYPGELGGADLLKQERDQLGRSNRDKAIHELVRLRWQGFPLDNTTLEKAGEEYGVSRPTVDRDRKRRRHETMIVAGKGGGIVIDTLENLLRRRRR